MATLTKTTDDIPILGDPLQWMDDPFEDAALSPDNSSSETTPIDSIVIGILDRNINTHSTDFCLRDANDKTYAVTVEPKKAFHEHTAFKKGEMIAVSGYCLCELVYGDIICSAKTGELLKRLSPSCDTKDFLMKFVLLNETKKNHLKDAVINVDTKSDEQTSVHFNTPAEHRVLFEIQRNRFSAAVQSELETLIKAEGPVSKRNNDSRRLNYMLNISNAPLKGERKLTPKSQLECLKRRVVGNETLLRKIAHKDSGCLLLCGPQGIGKETVAKAVAEIRGLPFVKLNLRGISSANSLIGDAPGYADGDAGIITKAFYNISTTRCVMYLEGAEGMTTGSTNGHVYETLAGVLRKTLTDSYLQMPIDVSNTLFIVSASSTESIPYCLMNCFEGNCFTMDTLSRQDKIYLLKKAFADYAIRHQTVPLETVAINDAALHVLLDEFTCDKGMDMAIANLELLCDEAFAVAKENNKHALITKDYVRTMLSRQMDDQQPIWSFIRNRNQYSLEDRQFIADRLEEINHANLCENDELKKWKDYFMKLNRGLYKGTDHSINPDQILTHLSQNHSCMDGLILRMVEKLYSNSLSIAKSSTRFLLFGPAGSGKTSLAKSLAEATGRELIRISLNGQYDSQYLKGNCYDGGILLKKLSTAKKGVIVLLDEIEKANTAVQDSLLDVLDGNSTYIDQFYRISLDLSDIIFIATANSIDELSPWLLDRFEAIEMSNYNVVEKRLILDRHLLPAVNKRYQGGRITMSNDAKALLMRYFENGSGIRKLNETLTRLVERKIYDTKSCDLEIVADDVADLMGPLPFHKGNLPKDRRLSGFVQGLSVLGNRGIVFSIETLILPKGEQLITGSALDDVCQCVSVAHSWIRKMYPQYGDFGYHVHFGEESIKKGGPSAGLAILLSMLSTLSNQPINGNYAFTGEVSLLGGIYAVGGLQEKILAAAKEGCSGVYIPSENYLRLDDEFLQNCGIDVIPCDDVQQVINDVLFQNQSAH